MKKIVKQMRVIYGFAALLLAVFVILNEISCLPKGYFIGQEQIVYQIHTLCVLCTMFSIYISLKIFSIKPVRTKMERMSDERRIVLYRQLSYLRIVLLFFTALFDFVVYYATLELTGGLCALMVLMSAVLCWPVEILVGENKNSDRV